MNFHIIFAFSLILFTKVLAIDNFSFALYSQFVSQINQNIIISPFSAKIALSMVSEGSKKN